MQYTYYINLNERGMFNADVRNPDGKTVFEIPTSMDAYEMVEDGFWKHYDDLNGLSEYLCSVGIITLFDTLVLGN